MIKIFQVSGLSMQPLYPDKSFIIILKRFFKIKIGNIYVIKHPDYGFIIKRLIDFDSEKYWFSSNNKLGMDHNSIGPKFKSDLVGKVILNLKIPIFKR
jgi:phage repressor protein C with HTH and peptisase S24 domain